MGIDHVGSTNGKPPPLGRQIAVVLGKDRWTAEETKRRAENPNWLFVEAKACLILAVSQKEPSRELELLRSAIHIINEMPSVVERRRIVERLADEMEGQHRSRFLELVYAASEKTTVGVTDHDQLLSELKSILSGYIPGPAFWEQLYAGISDHNRKLPPGTIATTYPRVDESIGAKLDEIILDYSRAEITDNSISSRMSAIRKTLDDIGIDNDMAESMNNLAMTLDDPTYQQALRRIIDGLRSNDFSHSSRAHRPPSELQR